MSEILNQENQKNANIQPEAGAISHTPRSRKRKGPHRPRWIICGIGAAVIGGLAAGYCLFAQRYERVFFPRTVINGVEASGKTADELKELISAGTAGYRLTVYGRDSMQADITQEDLNLHPEFDGTLEYILEQQNPYGWLAAYFHPVEYTISTMVAYDQELLDQVIDDLPFFQEDLVVQPEDARISEYLEGVGYEIIPETEGNAADREKVKAEIVRSVVNLQPEIRLEELDCYLEPEVRADDEKLTSRLEILNRYVHTEIRHQFGSREEILNGDTIYQWLVFGEDGSISLDREQVSQYVSNLANKYNTAYRTRSFKTSYGPTVNVSGSYGWRLNQEAETEELIKLLDEGTSQSREPVYLQKAASHDGNDYGNTYVEVNLTAQHMFFYKDGEKVLESDFVSGNVKKNYTTPPGIFGLTYKQRDAVLRGEGYASPVDFWMPFNGGIGFHDATWRSSFGGTIYKTNGSHGCINMPYDAAKKLYDYVYTNVPVICYNLEGTENTQQSSSKPETAPSVPETAASVPETAPSVPETTASVPETAPSMPETTASVPETAPSVPETTPSVSETTSAVQETENPKDPVVIPVESETSAESSAASGEASEERGPGTVATTAASRETEIGPGV